MSEHKRCKRCGIGIEISLAHRIEDQWVCYPCKVRHQNLMVRVSNDKAARPAQWR